MVSAIYVVKSYIVWFPGAVLIAQWCQPTLAITENGVSDQLDDVANMVSREIATRCQDHPAVQPLEHIKLSGQALRHFRDSIVLYGRAMNIS